MPPFKTMQHQDNDSIQDYGSNAGSMAHSQSKQTIGAHAASSPNMLTLTGKSKIVNTHGLMGGPAMPAQSATNLTHTGKRRIHLDGFTMLDKHYNMNENHQKLAIMENRVKRLQFEEDRARKMADLAQNRADKMLDARKRDFSVSQKMQLLLTCGFICDAGLDQEEELSYSVEL